MSTQIERFVVKPGAESVLSERLSQYPEKYFYKPISINVQGEVYCPVGCPGCGINSVIRRENAARLPIDTRIQVLEQAYDAGFISYLGCIGNAEPFTSIELLGDVLEQFRGRLDNTKINTSCITFTDTDKTTRQLGYLKEKGWAETKYVIPVLSLSLGMQQEAGVPLERIVNGIEAFHKVYTPDEARLSISHYHTTTRYLNSVIELEQLYRERTGRCLYQDAAVKTNEILEAGRAKNFPTEEFEQFQLGDKVSDRKCFGISIAEYVDPVMTVDEFGDIWMCPAFGPHKGILLGNIGRKTIQEAIVDANENEFFRLVAEKGTRGVYEIAKKYEPEIGSVFVTNRHAACAKLYAVLLDRPEFREQLRQRYLSK